MSELIEKQGNAPAPYYPAPYDQEENGDLRSILAFLRRRRRIIMTVAVLGTMATGFFAFIQVPNYTAQTMVMIEPRDAKVVDVQAVMAGISSDAATIETQVQLLTSRTMAQQVVDKLNLADPEAEPEPLSMQEQLLEQVRNLLPENFLIATGLAHEDLQLEPETAALLAREQKAIGLAEAVKVRQEGRSLVLSIGFTDKNPGKAAQIVNTYADLYVANQIEDKTSTTRRATEWLEIRLTELKSELETAEAEAERYRAQNQLLVMGANGVSMQSQQITNLTTMLVQARAEKSERESRLRYIRDLQEHHESLNTISEVMNSPYMGRLWEQEREMQQREAELASTFGPKHPQVLLMRAEQSKIRDKINSEMQRVVDNVGNEIKVLTAREQSIQADIDRLIGQTDQAGQAELKLREMERQITASRALYETFLQRYKETKEQEDLAEANARVIAKATPPERPSSPAPPLVLLVGLLASSMLGTGVAFLVERLDNTIRSGKEVERYFGLPCLALVPRLPKSITKQHGGAHGYLVAKPLSAFAETVRSIFTALRLSNVDTPPKVIQVTSSVPSEGKTTLSVSLASSLAHHGQKVVLIDLDIRHPSVGRELGTKEKGKLVEYMAGEASREELIYRDEERQIDVISVNRQSANPGAIITSAKMRELLDELRATYDYVIVDSTPVLGVSDSKLTAELVDTSIFVIRWEVTTKDVAEDALKELTAHHARIGGVVISQVDIHKHARYGYGGVDHYYSKYQKYYVN